MRDAAASVLPFLPRPPAAPGAPRRPLPEGGAALRVLYDEPPPLFRVPSCRRFADGAAQAAAAAAPRPEPFPVPEASNDNRP